MFENNSSPVDPTRFTDPCPGIPSCTIPPCPGGLGPGVGFDETAPLRNKDPTLISLFCLPKGPPHSRRIPDGRPQNPITSEECGVVGTPVGEPVGVTGVSQGSFQSSLGRPPPLLPSFLNFHPHPLPKCYVNKSLEMSKTLLLFHCQVTEGPPDPLNPNRLLPVCESRPEVR